MFHSLALGAAIELMVESFPCGIWPAYVKPYKVAIRKIECIEHGKT
jgi:hypothetical protein